MGFLDSLLDFLNSIFGRRPQRGAAARQIVQRAKPVTLEEARQLAEEKSKTSFDELERVAFARFAEIKHLLTEIKNELNNFESRNLEEEEGNQRLRKIVETSKRNLTRQMHTLAEKLSPPESHEYAVLRQYCLNSSAILSEEVNTFGRNVMYTGILMKKEVKNLGGYINELNTIFLGLKTMFESGGTGKALSAKSSLKQLQRALDERELILKDARAVKGHLAALTEERRAKEAALSATRDSADAKELGVLEAKKASQLREKQELKNKFINLLAPIDRPLNRFMKLAESGAYPLSDAERALLNAYMTNPFHAAKQDPKAQMLKKMLKEVENLVHEEKIKLKEKEAAKMLRSIAELQDYDFFGELFWRLNSIDVELIATEKSIATSKAGSAIMALEREIRNLDRAYSEQGALLKAEEQKLLSKDDEIAGFRESAETMLQGLAGTPVAIKVPADS
ncbi:MAG: hypothetical protein V1676_05080 [Candidatus Diapherotrites archaeon]